MNHEEDKKDDVGLFQSSSGRELECYRTDRSTCDSLYKFVRSMYLFTRCNTQQRADDSNVGGGLINLRVPKPSRCINKKLMHRVTKSTVICHDTSNVQVYRIAYVYAHVLQRPTQKIICVCGRKERIYVDEPHEPNANRPQVCIEKAQRISACSGYRRFSMDLAGRRER